MHLSMENVIGVFTPPGASDDEGNAVLKPMGRASLDRNATIPLGRKGRKRAHTDFTGMYGRNELDKILASGRTSEVATVDPRAAGSVGKMLTLGEESKSLGGGKSTESALSKSPLAEVEKGGKARVADHKESETEDGK